MRGALVLLVAVWCAACGPLSPPKSDAGQGGGVGGGTGGGVGGGLGGGLGGGTGGGLGGGTGGGLGGGADGGTGGGLGGGTGGGGGGSTQRTFATMILGSTPTSGGAVKGFAESGGAIWAVSEHGYIFRSTGGEFTPLVRLQIDGSNAYVKDFTATPDGTFFVLSTLRLAVCSANCDQQANWTDYATATSAMVLETVCGNASNDVIAVGADSSYTGVAYRWNGSSFRSVSTNLGLDSPAGCWRDSAGDLVFGARDGVVHYRGGGFSAEPLPLVASSVSAQTWRTGAVVGADEVVAGWAKRLAKRVPGGLSLLIDEGSGEFRAMAVPSATEAWVFGGGPSAGASNAWRFDGQRWAKLVPPLPIYRAHAAFLSSTGALYVGGEDDNFNPVILKGTP